MNRRIAVAMAADGRGWPWKLLRLDVRGNCRGNRRELLPTSVVIASLPWQWPRMAVENATEVSTKTAVAIATDFRRLPWLVRRSLPRTELQHVPWPQPWHLPWKCHEPWHLPWKPEDFHGSPWQHLRISPRKFRGHCRGPPPKSQIVCIRGR